MQPKKKHNSCLEGPGPHSDMAEDYHIGHLKNKATRCYAIPALMVVALNLCACTADTDFVKPSFVYALNVFRARWPNQSNAADAALLLCGPWCDHKVQPYMYRCMIVACCTTQLQTQ